MVITCVALVVPVLVGLVIGGGAASACTGGLECLGYLIWGVLGGAVVGVIAAIVTARRLRLSWLLILTLVIGWVVLAVTFQVLPYALTRTGAPAQVWLGLALAWPFVLSLCWGRGRGKVRWLSAAAVALVVLLVMPALAWQEETGRIEWARDVMSGSSITLLGPAGDELVCLGPFSANEYEFDRTGVYAFAYKLAEPPDASGLTKEWYVRVPADGEVLLDPLGDPDPTFRSRLRPVSRDWLATCGQPMHRWALEHGWWGKAEPGPAPA